MRFTIGRLTVPLSEQSVCNEPHRSKWLAFMGRKQIVSAVSNYFNNIFWEYFLRISKISV